MPGIHIHVLEGDERPGGGLDSDRLTDVGYVMRGGREMDNHFECMWDLFCSIPSIGTEGVSVLDEYYWPNKKDPSHSPCRATHWRGQDARTHNAFGISDRSAMQIMRLFMTLDEDLENARITDAFDSATSSTPTSGCTGAPCSRSKTTRAHWR